MKRWTLLATLALALIGGSVAWAMDDKDNEKLRKEILKKVEERLKSEHDRVMREVEKIIDEELSKMAEEEEEEEPKPKPKPKPLPKPKPKPEPPPNNDEPGYMGVYPEDMTADMRKLLKLKDGEGVLIAGVSETGPAAKSGLKANDVVLEVDGESVGTSDELREAVQGHSAGESVTLTVLRKKERKELKVKLASREEMESEEPEAEEEDEDEDEEEDTKPVKKPKVTFEKRADAPKFDNKTAEQLREEIRKFLDETLKKNEENGTPKFVLAPHVFEISGPDDEEEEEAPRAPRNSKELKELTKRFLRQLLEKLEQEEEESDEPEEEGDEDESPFGMNEEIQRMLEQFKKEHGGQMEELQEKMREMMEKMQDPEALEKMLQGMDPAALQEQLQQWLGQKGLPGGKDEEDLTEPDQDEENKTPPVKPQPDKNGKAWLGISPEELSPEMKKQLKVESGVIVRDVVEGSPAAEAGLKEGDVILFIDGEDLDGPEALQKALSGHKPGTKVDLVILRKGKQVTKSVTLAARKKIAVPSDLAPSKHDIGTEPPKKEKKEKKKKVEKKERREELPFDPATLGQEFMKGQGFKFAILDKNGKVILKQPLERMADMLEMGRRFGFMPGEGKKADKKESHRKETFEWSLGDRARRTLGNKGLRDLLERHGRGAQEFLFKNNDGEKCPFGCPDCEKRQKSMKKERVERHEFKFSGPEGRKPQAKRKTERREFRFELPGKGDKKNKGTAEQLEQAHREIEKAMKEFGGKNVPAELKKELHKLMEDLHKSMEKNKNKTRKMIAA